MKKSKIKQTKKETKAGHNKGKKYEKTLSLHDMGMEKLLNVVLKK